MERRIYNSRRKRVYIYLVNGASFPAYFVVKQNLIESQLILDIQTAGGKKNIKSAQQQKIWLYCSRGLSKAAKRTSQYT